MPTFDCSSSRHRVRKATLVTPAIGASTTGPGELDRADAQCALPPAHRQLAAGLLELERGSSLARAGFPIELAPLG